MAGQERRTALFLALSILILALAAAGGLYLWLHRPPSTPAPASAAPVQGIPLVILPSPTPGPTSAPTPPTVEVHVPEPTFSPAPTRIRAPAIELDAPVVEVFARTALVGGLPATEWLVPDDAAGYHSGSAYPGHGGNTVISGHHNMGTQVFRRLIDIEIGDEIVLWAGEQQFHYTVFRTELFPERGLTAQQQLDNGRWIAPTADERLTLVTCWPYSGNSHRLVVVARPER